MALRAARPTLLDRITQDPNVMVGKPVVRGTRIPVELVLRQLSYNLDLNELFAAYPRLTIEDVKACLAYAQAAVEAKRSELPGRSPPAPLRHEIPDRRER